MSAIGSNTLVSNEEIGSEMIVGFNDASHNDTGIHLQASPCSAVAPEQGPYAFVGRSIADVERDLILETLKHCLGNRTRATNLLRISIRTMRNKLNKYASEGVYVPAHQGGG